MEIIKLNNLTFSYPGTDKPALSNINLSIRQGEFVVLCGKSGSGKTTLQRLLKPELKPEGSLSGDILLFGENVKKLSARESACKIGFVQQNVEYQLVTHSVRSELAFGLENINLSNEEITARIAETASFFSLSNVLDNRVSTLSGGQKQLLCLASVCAMHPDVIILDEPVSQLDPVTVEKFINVLKKLRDEFSITIIISEHRLEELIPVADKIIALENGQITFCDSPDKMINKAEKGSFLYDAMPTHLRLCSKLNIQADGITVSDAKKALIKVLPNPEYTSIPSVKSDIADDEALKIKHLYYSYEGNDFVLNDLSLAVNKSCVFALMGENGSGKSTLIKLLTGVLKSKKGSIELFGKKLKDYKNMYDTEASLPQKVETLFAGPTINDDMLSCLAAMKISKAEKQKLINKQADFFGIHHLLKKHPYDVSGGEMQKSALAMVMLKECKILFLDEPTKGMDNSFKKELGDKLTELSENGITVFMVCHDVEFCAVYAHKCALLFDGRIIAQNDTANFFAGNYFYTTTASRMTRGLFVNSVTESMVEELWAKNQQ